MLRLHGFTLSNYFNMVKAVLLEKGMDFDFVEARPSQEPDYLARSPMGKVPCLETAEGFLSETRAILEYLEDIRPEPALLPAEPFARAKVRELMQTVELYIELPGRRCYSEVFFGGKVEDATKAEVHATLQKGVQALQQLIRFDPYAAGRQISLADFTALYTLPIAGRVAKRLWSWDLMAELPGVRDWLAAMNALDSVQRVRAEQPEMAR